MDSPLGNERIPGRTGLIYGKAVNTRHLERFRVNRGKTITGLNFDKVARLMNPDVIPVYLASPFFGVGDILA